MLEAREATVLRMNHLREQILRWSIRRKVFASTCQRRSDTAEADPPEKSRSNSTKSRLPSMLTNLTTCVVRPKMAPLVGGDGRCVHFHGHYV